MLGGWRWRQRDAGEMGAAGDQGDGEDGDGRRGTERSPADMLPWSRHRSTSGCEGRRGG